jgi:hypothetical protein
MPRRRQCTRDRPAHNAPMNAEFCRHTGDRADPKFVLPTEPKLAAVALANKTARIAWKMMLTGETYTAKSALAAMASAA